MEKPLFCVGPAPFLWRGLFYFIPALILILIVLGVQMSVIAMRNKRAGKPVINNRFKSYFIWFSVVALSLVAYGLIGLDFELYVLEFFVLSTLILGAFFIGERHRLFVVHHSRWVIVAAFAVLFAAMFLVCWADNIRQRTLYQGGEVTNCINRTWF